MCEPQPIEHICNEGSQAEGNEDLVASVVWKDLC